MYSKRFNVDLENEEFYRFSKLSKEKEKVSKLSKEKILDLGIGDPSTFPPLNVINEIKDSMDNTNYQGYSDNGILDFRYKVSNYLGVPYKCVTHTIGTKSALNILAFMYLDKTCCEGTPWHTKSTQKRRSLLVDKKFRKPLIWQGVPINRT